MAMVMFDGENIINVVNTQNPEEDTSERLNSPRGNEKSGSDVDAILIDSKQPSGASDSFSSPGRQRFSTELENVILTILANDTEKNMENGSPLRADSIVTDVNSGGALSKSILSPRASYKQFPSLL
jgi:hypothetical protein